MAGSGAAVTVIFTEDTLIGNLWTFLGSPAGPQAVDITIDGVDLGNVQVTADWTGGTTFQFTCINGGRLIGLGGNGGMGGSDFGASGEAGQDGGGGSPGLTGAAGQTINVDIDEGFLLGGGGGGGGGSYVNLGLTGEPGSGGGGGAGFSVTTGGNPGSPSGIPAGSPGLNGGPSGPGAGGFGVGIGTGVDGGSGGNWGAGGVSGSTSNMMAGQAFFLVGGVGGRGGRAFVPNGSSLVLNGAKSEVTLRSEERLLGETTSKIVSFASSRRGQSDSRAGTTTHGYQWRTDGILFHIDSAAGGGGNDIVGFWSSGVAVGSFGDDYEVRNRNKFSSQDKSRNWDSEPGPQGTFFPLTSFRSWTLTSSSGIQTTAGLFEIRLISAPASDIIDSVLLSITDENAV